MIPAHVDAEIESTLDRLDELFSTLPNDQAVEAWEIVIDYGVYAMQGLTSSG